MSCLKRQYLEDQWVTFVQTEPGTFEMEQYEGEILTARDFISRENDGRTGDEELYNLFERLDWGHLRKV